MSITQEVMRLFERLFFYLPERLLKKLDRAQEGSAKEKALSAKAEAINGNFSFWWKAFIQGKTGGRVQRLALRKAAPFIETSQKLRWIAGEAAKIGVEKEIEAVLIRKLDLVESFYDLRTLYADAVHGGAFEEAVAKRMIAILEKKPGLEFNPSWITLVNMTKPEGIFEEFCVR